MEAHNGHILEEEVHSGHILETLHIVLYYNEKMECPQIHGILQVCGEASHDDKEGDGHEEAPEMLSTCHGHGAQRQESLYHSVVAVEEAEEHEEPLLVRQVEDQCHHTHRHSPQCHNPHSLRQ